MISLGAVGVVVAVVADADVDVDDGSDDDDDGFDDSLRCFFSASFLVSFFMRRSQTF